MKGIALGTIVIDEDYTIVDFNEPVQKLIPAMAKNAKCYQALLGKDKPCSFCPVLRKEDCVVDVEQNNMESVVTIPLAGHQKQYVLTFLINAGRHEPSLNCLKFNLHASCITEPDKSEAAADYDLDQATGVYNMQAFIGRAQKLLDDNPHDSFNLIISDIKNFQLITATYGEAKAQALLRDVAQLTKECYTDGVVARYGVDQIVSLYKTPNLDTKIQISKRFNEYLQQTEIPNVIIKFGIYEDGVSRLPLTGRTGKRCPGIQQGTHRGSRKQRNIHRGERYGAALAAKIVKPNLYGVKHLGGFVGVVAKEDHAAAGQMPLQRYRVEAGDHDDFADSGLPEGCHHPLGNGNGADA